jgi:hypothetical protein
MAIDPPAPGWSATTRQSIPLVAFQAHPDLGLITFGIDQPQSMGVEMSDGAAGREAGTPPPAAPTGLAAGKVTTDGVVRLFWIASPGTTGYNIYRDDIKILSTTNTAADVGVDAGPTYLFAVTATNLVGESPKSSAIRARARPSSPERVVATPVRSSVRLS